MDIELVINNNIEKEKIVIYAKEKNQRIIDILNKISIENDENIVGHKDDEVFILDRMKYGASIHMIIKFFVKQ